MNKDLIHKIGIMGGTFDPPHLGHLEMAEYAAEELALEKVIFVPTGKFKYKDSTETSSAEDRYNMTKLAIGGNPIFEISDVETQNDEYSYTYSTLAKLHTLHKNSHFYFIVGADSLDYIDRWKNPRQIFKSCTVAVFARDGFSSDMILDKVNELKKTYDADIEIISAPIYAISSTMVKKRIKSGKSVRYMIPENVIEYIKNNNLYIGEQTSYDEYR